MCVARSRGWPPTSWQDVLFLEEPLRPRVQGHARALGDGRIDTDDVLCRRRQVARMLVEGPGELVGKVRADFGLRGEHAALVRYGADRRLAAVVVARLDRVRRTVAALQQRVELLSHNGQ